jgi:hypothetical protein
VCSRLQKEERAVNVPYHSPFTSQNNPLALKLECIFSLTEEEKQALTSLPVHVMTLKGDQDIVRVGDRPPAAACSWRASAAPTR